MTILLDDLAKKPFRYNTKIKNLFNILDNVCTAKDASTDFCNSFENISEDEPLNTLLKKFFTILKRYQTSQHNYLQDVLSSEDNNCVYYKYWFYNKLISNNSDQSNIHEFYKVWNVYKGKFFGIIGPPCKLHTKNMYDVKIIKLIYDFVLFRDIAKNNYNVIEDIEKCEFCKYFAESLKRDFSNGEYTCTTWSPFAFCMEHNEYLKKFFNLNRLSSLSCKYDENVPHNNKCPHVSEQVTLDSIPMVSGEKDRRSDMLNEVQINRETEETNGRDSYMLSVIGGVVTLGIFFIVFFLYKFTSFGSLVRRRTRRAINIWKNQQTKKKESLMTDSDTEDINSQTKLYNLAYYPAENY